MLSDVAVREGTKNDCKGIYQLLKELAEYEKLPQNVKISEADLVEDGFGDDKFFYTVVAELKNPPTSSTTNESTRYTNHLIGYALYYYAYSTWNGRAAFLEDIYVKEEHRGKGIGTELLRTVTKNIRSRGCVRLDFVVLNWNAPSLGFYRHYGGCDMTSKEGWHLLRFGKEELEKLAQ